MTDIALTDLTSSTTGDDGTGVYDVLMRAVEAHLAEQYDLGRITGPEYATVYLGAMQTVLQQSIQFLLQEQEAGHRADLVEAQKQDQQAETQVKWYTGLATLRKQWGYEPTATEDNAVYDITGFTDQADGLIDQQIADAQNEAENKNWLTIAQLDKQWGFTVTRVLDDITDIAADTTGMIDYQIAQTQKQIDLTGIQISAESSNILLVDQKRLSEEQQTSILGYQLASVLPSQVAKVNADTSIAGYQLTDILPTEKAKITAETQFTDQKKATEITNQRIAGFTGQARLDKEYGYTMTVDATNKWDITTITSGTDGLFDAKIALVEAQTLGFATDTKQKVLRQMLETWSVMFSIDAGQPIPECIRANDIDAVQFAIMRDVDPTWVDPIPSPP